MRGSAVCCAIILSLAAGCGAVSGDAGSGDAAAPVAASGEPAASGKDCGTFERLRPDAPGISAEGLRCFVDAVEAREAARLRFTFVTTEGDPIPTSYTARTDGRIEVLHDSRRDSYSAPANRVVTRQLCTGPQPVKGHLMFADCAPPRPAG